MGERGPQKQGREIPGSPRNRGAPPSSLRWGYPGVRFSWGGVACLGAKAPSMIGRSGLGGAGSVRVAAVDWSGRAQGARRSIWTALAAGGELLALEADRDRAQTADHLVQLALDDPDLVVGMDFAFSLPLWFLDRCGFESGMTVPDAVAEGWLRDCPPPFWGRPGRGRGREPQHRATELEVAPRAKSVFQIGGAGAVGTGSLRGFALLRRLRAAGFAIWPFDPPRRPVAVEIFPRLLTGPVVKSRTDERERYLRERGWPMAAAVTEDAFDAAVSALVMERHAGALAALTPEVDPVIRREGRIWTP
jgi:Protein of unknown function (DUF429)